MNEIDTIKEKETLNFSEVYNDLLTELSENLENKGLKFGPIPEILKNSLTNNFKKSILAANEKLNQTYSMNKAVINFIREQDFTFLRLELVEFDDAFRNNSLQLRKARLEFACSFDDQKEKYLLMDVQKEILLTDRTTGNFRFNNLFSCSLQPILDEYVKEYDEQLGSKTSNTKIISIKKSDFTGLLRNVDPSAEDFQIVFHPAIVKDRDLVLYEEQRRQNRTTATNFRDYKDQFSLFMIAGNSTKLGEPGAYDTFCLNPPTVTCPTIDKTKLE
ncbi:hypothetical protein [Flavobacterium sp. UGB4466]|uniref:hypothetical protein n=1 Tax=Flavobacterium sp. UGB4466 TaxID=2730889 RepID=UPI00192CB0AC|nr:hypothetical protein [Flavobacterium sp. UGB4466]